MKISTNQTLDRWDTLPMVLREALCSEPNSDFLWKTCEAEHIPDKKIYGAARISGYVLMGFLHPEDVAEALRETIGADQKTALSIQTSLNQRIFSPLRAEIDKIYAPLSKFEAGPKLIQEITPPQMVISTSAPMGSKLPTPPTPRPMPTAAPAPKAPSQMISATASGASSFGATPLATNKNNPAPAPAPTKPNSEKGWSKQAPQGPSITLGVITPSVPTPAANGGQTSAPSFQSPAQVPGKTMSEFERIDMMKKGTAPQTPGPAPVMLHQVTDSAPLQKTPDFRFNTGMQNQMGAKPAQTPVPPKAAVLEFATKPSNVNNTPVMPKPPAPPQAPSANTGPRQVTEITAPKPMATPPMPPQAPTQPKEKVIVKDFLGPQK